jgi:formylglycine-generating enzyme required for sulfatase activity
MNRNPFNICPYLFLFLIFFKSCNEDEIDLKAVTYSQFESFVNETGYITDAEKFGWSIVQLDVYNYTTSENATWKIPDGINKVASGALPVTQVSYNDALAYCKWAKKRLPSYNEYWDMVKNDTRVVVSDNKYPISEIDTVNVVGNVWDITKNKSNEKVRLAGGSLFCSEKTCHGTIKKRELFVDKETGNINIGFSVIDL